MKRYVLVTQRGRVLARGTLRTCRRQKECWRAFFAAYGIPVEIRVALARLQVVA